MPQLPCSYADSALCLLARNAGACTGVCAFSCINFIMKAVITSNLSILSDHNFPWAASIKTWVVARSCSVPRHGDKAEVCATWLLQQLSDSVRLCFQIKEKTKQNMLSAG